MAKKKPRPKVPRTAMEKEARSSLTIARELGLAQNRAKQAAGSRGAFRERKLRSGGDMSRYNLGRFKDDPFPAIVVGPPGGYSRTAAAPGGSRPTAPRSPKPAPKPAPKREVGGDIGKHAPKPKPPKAPVMDAAERREKYLAEQARKKAEEAKKKQQGKENKPRSSGNTSKAL